MSEKKPQLSALTHVAFQVNSTIAEADGKDISFDDVYKGLERGRLLETLNEKMPDHFDFSLFKPGDEQNVALNRALKDAAAAFQGRELRKSGIESSGLHLVMACLLEAIQRQDWVDDMRSASAV
jgi:hypothetical protein